ncbi:schwannomin-interacting protein 1-like isoform X2 [Melanotaenia boesemani]|uniref:schwannomin-interacting protein 1-like isoform X2 n=1 Tax=Melanotaenia boesemani TaxID=1250792 RepID=UPI001C04A79C|nr:schwannomin-interacting protein 1-like isoform X2 [Melanotaenia boesemani]
MEGEKETAEEKEEEEEEKELHHQTVVASSANSQGLPIMHWEDLSQRIAELEKQEQQRRERTKRLTGLRMEEEDAEDVQRCRVVSSRFHNHRNLQLCFINDSDSEEEEEEADKKVPMGTRHNGCHAAGLKQEVATALRVLRDKLLAEQKEEQCLAGSSHVAERKHLEPWQLQESSVQQLTNTKASLQQEVHALSSELVAQLLVRDQLRTKQDAMLLDVQDLT